MVVGDKDLLDRAVQALKVLEPDDVAAIVAKLVELRPEVREPIVKAIFGQVVEVAASQPLRPRADEAVARG